ncbi:MAG: hypothetical protein DLM67_19530 [Candidatus Nephthysia bennettiae]|uniref:Uncharacterized protein n=1 Tax=Candidatus Nephthysia bennettiae TaxID=3127016 RepID=A0A934N6H4_9BACT|nr:hypothetical protein [Candidatus Dormibacteraeota bacterium]MBJ7611837.1 hypothetical protein [Candidatus Dormibacteraeota bacterium]PZR88949.1 MAG: hypothetical protein DLM67_19530 [Candidatus Dormibacteraeota bacterium]
MLSIPIPVTRSNNERDKLVVRLLPTPAPALANSSRCGRTTFACANAGLSGSGRSGTGATEGSRDGHPRF